ncbi:MAG: hypothetical protein J5728_00805 [Lachnospiraceae bacterium]|nr:hypothetical protein [Lachnospiraceae bacterium]
MEENRFDPIKLIKEILLFLGVSALAFGWMMLMLLIVSFVVVSVITLKLKTMFIVAIAFTLIIDIYYVIRRSAKKREERRIMEMLGKK